MSDHTSDIARLCRQIGKLLASRDRRIVFAESCTAGLVSASLAAVPGISRYLCGSAVTYREKTKTQWLGVSEDTLERHTAVSETVATSMAVGALIHTPEADFAVSVTGHLGPQAPPEQDGLVFVGLAQRDRETGRRRAQQACGHHLKARTRLPRQREAVLLVLQRLRTVLESPGEGK